MKRKVIAILMTAVMLTAMLTGCQSKEPVKTEVKEQTQESTPKKAQVSEHPGFGSGYEDVGDENENIVGTESNEDLFAIFGTIDGSSYKNDTIGIGFDLPEGWNFYSQEQIDAMNGFVIDAMDDETLKQQIENSTGVYDMYAANETTASSINIALQYLGAAYDMSELTDTYMTMMQTQVQTALESMNCTDVTGEVTVKEMAGQIRNTIHMECSYQGIPLYEDAVIIMNGGYMACVTFACFNENTLSDMESMIYELNATGPTI